MKVFRKLNEIEEQEFRAWARSHYEAFTPIDGMWHPVIQAECARINANYGEQILDHDLPWKEPS